MNRKLGDFSENDNSIRALIDESASGILTLARDYFEMKDYSGSIALCILCVSKCQQGKDGELDESLILLASNLYQCGLPRRVYLRPLAVSLLKKKISVLNLLVRDFVRRTSRIRLVDSAVILGMMLRISILESRGVFPKSLEILIQRFRHL
jgi:hypothetical protein